MEGRERITGLLGSIERYNPGNLPIFLEHLKKTVENGTYDIEAYLAILKLYQFNPARLDVETVKTILLKALTALPQNDFVLCLGLLTEEVHSDADVARIIYISELLEGALFEEFWAYLKENDDLLTKAKVLIEEEESHEKVKFAGFQDAIRNYAAHIIRITYQSVSSSVIAAMTNLSGAELNAFLTAQSFTLQQDGVTVFITNQEDHVKSKDIVENIPFKSLVNLMAASQVQ